MIDEETIVVADDTVPPAPPVDTQAAATWHAMAAGEPFTREQYIGAGWTDDQLIAEGKMTVIAPPPAVIETIAPIGMPASSWILIEEHDDIPPTGLFLGHNGIGFLAKTGVPMYMPDYLIAILDDAIMDAPVVDPNTKKVTGYRPRRRYNYRRVEAPAEAA